MKRFGVMIAALVLGVVVASAQPKFTYADIAAGKFAQKSVYGLRSMNDGEHYTTRRGSVIYRHSYADHNAKEVLLDFAAAGVGSRIADYTFSPDESKIMFRLD